MSSRATTHVVPESVSAPLSSAGRLPAAFGRRAFLLFGLGLVLIGPAFLNRQFLWAMVAWDGLVLLAWLVDLRLLPKPREILATREWSGALQLGGETQMRLTFEGKTRTSLQLNVVASLPEELAQEPSEASLVFHHATENRLSIPVMPLQRGEAEIGPVFVRIQSPLGIAERWARVDLPQTVRVYPGTGNREEQSLNLLRTRRIEIIKRLSRHKGLGREFESLREYRQGDAMRDICWPATARRARLIVKEYQVERGQPIWIMLDCGRLMRARVGNRTKLDSAVAAALNLAEVAMFGGDRVGLFAYGHHASRMVGLGRGDNHLRLIMDQLSLVQGESGEADHFGAAAKLLAKQSRRSLIVWITDLPDSVMTPEVYEGASVLLGRHLVIFAAIADPELKTEAEKRLRTPDGIFETAAAMDVLHRRERLIASLRARGAHTLEVEGGKLANAVVQEYLSIKERDLL